MPKPTIVFVINTLQRGGAERVVSVIGNSLGENKFNVVIACMNVGEQAYRISEQIRVVQLLNRKQKENLIRRIKYGLLTYYSLLKLLNKEKPICVISFMTSANLWNGLSCSMLRIPYVVSERTTPDHTINLFGFVFKWLAYIVYKKSKAIVVPSRGIEDCMKKSNLFSRLSNYQVIKNPINIFTVSTNRTVHHKKFILGVGRLSYEKGFDQLILAYHSLNLLDIDLVIVGGGGEREQLNELIVKLNLQNRVNLIGPVDELLDYYLQAELFVLPSRNEGYPNALIEAMSNGCACIAMNCEFGPSEIIQNRINGMLVENNDIHLLSECISEVLSNPTFKERISRNAKKVRQTNSLTTIAKEWENLILQNN